MALSDIDKKLLDRCLTRKPRAWEDFVDRFIGLVVHVVNHTASARSMRLSGPDQEDLISEVFLAIVENDFAALRRFRGQSSLATYLTVISRRVVVRKLMAGFNGTTVTSFANEHDQPAATTDAAEQRIANAEEVQQLISRLDGPEADVVRMYHLEGKTYHEISHTTGMPENSVGPMLSRARNKMRQQPTG